MLSVFSRFFFLMVIIGLSACAVMQPKTDEEVVERRSASRLEALKELDFEKAYTYMSPGYRSIKGLDRFKLDYAGAVNMLDFNVNSVECNQDTCSVLVASDYKVAIVGRGFSVKKPLVIDRVNKETWIRIEGKWWFVKSE